MAGFLSRNPSELQGASLKSETLWNDQFTVNSVICLKDVLEDGKATSKASASERNTVNRIIRTNPGQLIRKRDERNPRDASKNHCRTIESKVRMSVNSANKLLNEKLLPANYAADMNIQRVISIQKNYNRTAVSRLPSPWRENFQSFSLDDNNFVYMVSYMTCYPSVKETNDNVFVTLRSPSP